MQIKINVSSLRRELATRGLEPKDLDKKAKARPSWASSVLFRINKKAELRPGTLVKLCRAIGCAPEAIAIFEDAAPEIQPSPRPRKAKAKTNGKRVAAA